MKADEVVAAVRRMFGAETDNMGPEWAALDEFNLSGLSGGRCDLFLVRAWGGAPKRHERIAVEVKVSRQDLKAELAAPHKRAPFVAVAHRFYFACPAGLMRPEEVPEGCGLIEVHPGGCRTAVAAPKLDPVDLPERGMVEAFRRAARAEARIRTAEWDTDPGATIARLVAEADRAAAATAVARESARRADDRSRRYLELLLHIVGPDVPIPCQCATGPLRRHGLHWRHITVSDTEGCRYPWPSGPALAALLDANPDHLTPRNHRSPHMTDHFLNTSDEDVAHVCHDANRALQIITGDPAPSPSWENAPEWQRISAIEGVRLARQGLSPEQLHEAWCDHKLATGWTFGLVKDEAARTHPCLVPYQHLPVEQRAKDDLFRGIVTALTS